MNEATVRSASATFPEFERVERPDSVAELAELVRGLAADRRAIYPTGGGTAMNYGGPPARPGVLIETARLDRVVDYPAADMTITVEAGVTLAGLQSTLAAQGQRLQVDAPRPDRATLGGIFATNSTGPRRLGHGRPRDQILGVRFVDAAGRLVKGGGRVVKNVAGYDLPKLLTGSLGTLGIVAELTLKVRPLPEATGFAIADFKTSDSLAKALEVLNTSKTRPVALELWNARSAGRFRGTFPEGSSNWRLLIGYEARRSAIDWQIDALRGELEVPIETARDDSASAIWRGLEDPPDLDPEAVALVASVRPSALTSFADRLDRAGWAIQAHAASGVIHADRSGPEDSMVEEISEFRGDVEADGGSLVLAKLPSSLRPRLSVWGRQCPDWSLMARLKAALDPDNLLNPGRFDFPDPA